MKNMCAISMNMAHIFRPAINIISNLFQHSTTKTVFPDSLHQHRQHRKEHWQQPNNHTKSLLSLFPSDCLVLYIFPSPLSFLLAQNHRSK